MSDFLSTAGLRTAEIVEPQAFLGLRERWNTLASVTQSNSIFLRHEWFDAAWQWVKNHAQLKIICVYQGNDLIGIAPLTTQKFKYHAINLQKLEFLTVPDTQSCDILSVPEKHQSVIEAISRHLHQIRTQWDILELRYLDEKSLTQSLLKSAFANLGLTTEIEAGGENPFIALDSDWKTFYDQRTRSLKKANNLSANRLKKAGEIELVRIDGKSDEQDYSETLQSAIKISEQSWKERTGLTLDNPGPNAFIRALTAHAARNGWLSIWMLRLNGKAIAMEYQLVFDGNVHALRADFIHEYQDISPGSYLNWKMLEQLFLQQLKCYYMGPGNNAYKLRWTDQKRPLFQLTTYNSTLKGEFVVFVRHKLRPLLNNFMSPEQAKKE